MVARRDFSRGGLHHVNSGSEDFTQQIITAIVAIGVLGYIASRFFRRGATAAANANNRGNGPTVAGAPNPIATVGARGAALVPAAASANNGATLEERMATLAFGGWKIAVDVDAIAARPNGGPADPNPELRDADLSTEYFKKMLEAKADVYVYCQVERDPAKAPSPRKPYVGDASPELVGQSALLTLLKPFASSGLKREQVLFCATSKGHEAFTRQLQPTILVTTRRAVAELLARHVAYVVYVDVHGSPLENKYQNVISVDSLGRFSS